MGICSPPTFSSWFRLLSDLKVGDIQQLVQAAQGFEGGVLERQRVAADQQVAEAAEEQLRGQRDDHREQLLEPGDQEAVQRAAQAAHQQAGQQGRGQRRGAARLGGAGQAVVGHAQGDDAQRADGAHGDVDIAHGQDQHHAQRHEAVQEVRPHALEHVGEVEDRLLLRARRDAGGVGDLEHRAHHDQQDDQEEFPTLQKRFHFLHQIFLLARSCFSAMRCRITFSRMATSSRMPLTNSVIMELPMPIWGMAESMKAIISAPMTTPVILP